MSARKSLFCRGLNSQCHVEPLEERRLLSAGALPLAGYQTLAWRGQQVQAKQNQWVLRLNRIAGTDRQQIARAGHVLARARAEMRIVSYLGDPGEFLVRSRPGLRYAQLLTRVRRIGGFGGLEPNTRVHLVSTVPNDPKLLQQWHLNNTATPGADINAENAWDITTGSPEVIVAVIDTGVQWTHPDLAANIWTNPGEIPGDGIDNDHNGYVDDVHGWNFVADTNDPNDDNGHGTHVAGAIAAVGNNGVGVTGVGWDVKILPLKFIRSDGNGDISAAVAALNYIVMMKQRGFNIVLSNNSWGQDSKSLVLYQAVQANEAAGVLFVAAAGNNGRNTDTTGFYPASFDLPNIIAVAATDTADGRWSGSNYGLETVDVGAPGVSIYSTARGSGYSSLTGTSLAAPVVSGIAALAYSISPSDVGYQTIKDAVLNGGDANAALVGKTVTGKRVDAYGTLMQLPMLALAAVPGDGQVVTELPTDFMLTFSHPYDPAQLSAGALEVNGIAADSVTGGINASTAVFHFLSTPVTAQGLQSIAISAGAVTRLADGQAIAAFSSSFRYDALVMQVVSTVPASGSSVAPPLTEIDLALNEAVDAASVSPGDLVLSQGTVVSATLVDPQTIQYMLSGLDGESNVSLSLPAGALLDAYGNPSAAWTGTVSLDVTTAGYPPLPPAAPLGAMIHTAPLDGMINASGDTDAYTVTLKTGEQLAVRVSGDGDLTATVQVRRPDGSLLISGSGVSGGDAVAGPADADVPGVYTIEVAGSGNSVGGYTIQAAIDAAYEQELTGTVDNNTPASAQNLDGAFVLLPLGGARAGVIGRTDLPAGVLTQEVEPNDSMDAANAASLNFVPPADAAWQIGVKADAAAGGDDDYYNLGQLGVGSILTVSVSGVDSGRGTLTDPFLEIYRDNGGTPVKVTESDDDGPGTDSLVLQMPISIADTYYVLAKGFDNTVSGTYDLGVLLELSPVAPLSTNENAAESEPNDTIATATDLSASWRPVNWTSTTAGTLPSNADHDYYSYDFAAGDVVTVEVQADATLNTALNLHSADGSVLALEDGTSTPLGSNTGLWAYVIPTAGSYALEVYAKNGTGGYAATVMLSTDTAPQQPVPVPDYYAVKLAEGERLTAVLSAPPAGAVSMDLEDAAGELVSGQAGASGNADQLIREFVAPATGTYFLKLVGERNRDYQLALMRGSDFAELPGNTSGTAMEIGTTGSELGYIGSTDEAWFTIQLNAGDAVQLQTATPGEGAGEFANTLDPALEILDPTGATVASDANSAPDGRNALVNLTATTTGTYRIRLWSESGAGEYQLRVGNFTRGLPGGLGNDTYDVRLAGDGVTGQILVNGQIEWAAPVGMLDSLVIDDPAGDDTLLVQAQLANIPRLLGSGMDTVSLLAGTWTLGDDLGQGAGSAALEVIGASVELGVSQQLDSLSIGAGGRVSLLTGAGLLLRTSGIAISGDGVLDMADGDLVVDYAGSTPMQLIEQYIRNGRLGSGPAIVTAAAIPDGHAGALGMVDNGLIRQTTWKGRTISDGTNFRQVLVQRTYMGDVNLDGKTDARDYYAVFANMSAGGGGWFLGDVDLDGLVTTADVALVTQNLGAGTAPGTGL